MGTNPGGVPDSSNIKEKIWESIGKVPEKNWNAYFDENWRNNGKSALQNNYIALINGIGYSKETVFSTNLIFTRSVNINGINDFNKMAEYCWDVHKLFINKINPKCIIVFGNAQKFSPYQFIKETFLGKDDCEPIPSSGQGNYVCRCCTANISDKNRIIIGIPHLSRYYIGNHPTVINWIKEKMCNKTH